MSISREVLSPTTTAGGSYPALHGGNKKKSYALFEQAMEELHRSWSRYNNGWYNKASLGQIPDRIKLNNIVDDQLRRLLEMVKTMQNEFGALLLKRGEDIELSFFQVGKHHEIDLAPTRPLEEDEYLLGTCVLPETLILGDNKPISEYNIGNQVIGMDGLTEVKQVFRHEYNGPIIEVKAAGILQFKITSEHPILVSESLNRKDKNRLIFSELKWKQAKDLVPVDRNKGDYLVIPRIKGRVDLKELDLESFNKKGQPKKIQLDSNTAWLLGIYVAEGCGPERPRFCLHKDEIDISNRIKNIAWQIGYKTGEDIKDNRQYVSIYSAVLGRAFREWCGSGAHNKKIPDFILMHKDIELLKSFLEGYEAGDGYKNEKTRTIQVSTVSKVLAQQLQLAYARFGWFSTIWGFEGRLNHLIRNEIVNSGPGYGVSRILNPKHEYGKIFEDYILVPIRYKTMKEYNGLVCNLQTDENKYLVSNIVVHNCHAHPSRDYPSTTDVYTFLKQWEQAGIIIGSKGTIYLLIKTNGTIKPDMSLDEFDRIYETGQNVRDMAEDYKALLYLGHINSNVLNLEIGDSKIKTATFNDLLKDLKGVKYVSETVKKVPSQLINQS
jgi:hypothetical protein